MRLRLLIAGLLLLVVAAPAAAAPVLGPQAYYGTRMSGPLDPDVEPVTRPAEYAGPALELHTTYVGREAIEPTIGLDPQGRAFFPASTFEDPVYGVGGHGYLMRSTDQNRTWETIEPATQAGYDPPRDLDPWVYADADYGRVFDVGLLGAGSYLSYSDDGGETWTSSLATDPGVNDHQSIVTAVPPPGADPLLTPTDPAFPKIVYYCVNEVTRQGCSASADGGRTFIARPGSAYTAFTENEGDQGIAGTPVCGSLSGHVQADHEGRLFLPAGHCGRPYLAISEDGGRSWERVIVASEIGAADTHTEVAVDRGGNLYYVWFDPIHRLPWLATSTDHGRTWADPIMIAPPGVYSANLPTAVGGEPGRVAITFAGSTNADEADGVRPWNAYVVVSTDALAADPLFVSTIGNPAGDPVHRGSCIGRCGGMFDFLDIQVSPADGAVWATSSDSCTELQECNLDYEGDNSGGAADRQGMAMRQTGGPRLVGPLEPSPARSLPATPSPGTGARDRSRPRVTRLRASRRTFRAPRRRASRRISRPVTRFSWRLSEPATVALRFRRGRRTVGTIRTSAGKGRNTLSFTGRLGRRPLRRGRYRVTIIATDAAGNTGRSRPLRLRVR